MRWAKRASFLIPPLVVLGCLEVGEGRTEMVLSLGTSVTDFGIREGSQPAGANRNISSSFQAVYVTLKGIRLHQVPEAATPPELSETPPPPIEEGTWKTLLTSHRTINLLELQEGLREMVGFVPLEPGHYTEVRLLLEQTPSNDLNLLGQPHPFPHYVIDKEDEVHPLSVPSGEESGIKIIPGFRVEEGEVIELLMELDLTRSLVLQGQGPEQRYLFKPVIHSAQITDILEEEKP